MVETTAQSQIGVIRYGIGPADLELDPQASAAVALLK
jgi:hypothetical protein